MSCVLTWLDVINLDIKKTLSNRNRIYLMRFKADFILLFVALIWGTGFIAQNVAATQGTAYLFNGVCFLLASIFLFPLVIFRKGASELVFCRNQLIWMLLAGSVLFAATIFQQIGLFYTKVANAGFLTSLYTVFIPFLLWCGFREIPKKIDIIAILMAACGAFLLSTAGQMRLLPGDGLEILGAIFAGLHFVIIGKYATRYNPISFAAGQFLVAGSLSLLVGLFFEQPSALLSLPMIGAVLYRAVMPIGLGFTLQVWGQRHTSPVDAGIILSLESVFALLFAWLLLNQQLAFIQIVGCCIILVAVLVSQLKDIETGIKQTFP